MFCVKFNFSRMLFVLFTFVLQFSQISLAQATAPSQTESFDVVVIGGGIGGLATVDELMKKGVKKVLLLEAADRVGGKMWTQRGSNENAPYYERGAELVNTSDVELINLIKSLGLELVERRFKRDLRSELLMFRERHLTEDGRVIEGELRSFSFEQLVEKMHEFPQDLAVLEKILQLQALRSSQDPQIKSETLKEIRSMTARSAVEGGVYTTAFFESIMKSEFGVSLSEVNAEVLLDYASVAIESSKSGQKRFNIEIIPNADEKFRVKNGTDSIIRALEVKYSAVIRKNSEVTGVRQTAPNDFEISLNGASRKIKTQHVVFAVPAYDLPKLNIVSAEVSPRRIQEAAALPYGHNAKIFLVFNERFWDRAYDANSRGFGGVGVLESGVQFWDTTENQRQTKEGVITLFPGKWPTDAGEQKKRLAEIMVDLRKVPGFEGLDAHLVKVDVHNWQRSYAGVFNTFIAKSPRLFAENLASNMYFVGADKDNNTRGQISESYGYMNGAVRTAIRATSRIMQKLQTSTQNASAPVLPIRSLKPKKMACSALLLGA